MKKILAIFLLVFLILSLPACGSKENAPKTESQSEEVKSDPSKDAQEVKEEVKEEKTEATEKSKTETPSESSEVTEEKKEAEEDDFQKGIPEEYRLKRNVDKKRYEPLPEVDEKKAADFLKLFGSIGDPSKSKPVSP